MRIRWMILRALVTPMLLGTLVAIVHAEGRPQPPPATMSPAPNRTALDRDNGPPTDPSRLPDPRVRTPAPPNFPFGLEWGSWAPAGAAASGNPEPGFRNTPTQNP